MLEIQEKEINLNQMKILGKSCNILTSASWLFRKNRKTLFINLIAGENNSCNMVRTWRDSNPRSLA